jgi:hypothetical protein
MHYGVNAILLFEGRYCKKNHENLRQDFYLTYKINDYSINLENYKILKM